MNRSSCFEQGFHKAPIELCGGEQGLDQRLIAGAECGFSIGASVCQNPAHQAEAIAVNSAAGADRATALTNIFANVSLANGTSGSTATGRSTAEMDISTVATTATLIMRVVGLTGDDANLDYDAAGVNYIVRFNFHHNAPCSSSDSQTTAASTGI